MDDGASSRGKTISRNVIAALPVAFVLPIVAGLAGALDGLVSGPRVSTAATFTALVAPFLAGFVVLTRRRRPRAALLAACHALAWAPVIAIGAWQAIDAGIVQGHMRGCGTGVMAMFMVAIPVGGFALLAGGIAAGALLAHRETDRALRILAFVATALALVAFAFALPRVGRPDPDTYLASLTLEGELRTESEVQMAGRSFVYRRVNVAEPPVQQVGEGPGDPLPPRVECQLSGLGSVETFYAGAASCPVLRVRIDPGHDLAVLDAAPYGDSSGVVPIAFRPSTGEELGITAATVADRIGPPIGWTLGAAMGGLAGAAFAIAAARARRRASSLVGVEAEHTGNGWVVLPDGDRVLVDPAATLPVGAVVLGEVTEQLPTYRLMGVPRFASARPGTLALLRCAATDLAASLDGIAIAVAVLGATPLIVARIAGVF
jgi:hypothetical protein